jgi:hypothetical protein
MLTLLEDAITGLGDLIQAFEDFFSALVDPHTYVRLFFIVLGGAMAIGALIYGT